MESSGFFNSKNKDRVYLAEVFAEYFASFIGNGVFPNPSTGLQVKAAEPSSMEIIISPGRAFINGYWYKLDEEKRITLNNADGRLNRYDSVVIAFSKGDRKIYASVKTGEAESTPYIPGVVRDEDTYELRLAHISVKAGATKISNFDIVDDRLDTEVCGIVTGAVDQVDTTTLYNQIKADLDEFKNVSEADIAKWFADSKADFEAWFQSIEDKLGDDPATSLQQQVDNLNSAFAGGDLEVSNGTEQLFVRGIGDRISGFVIDGKTTQEGSGDPTPENKRPIKGVGRKLEYIANPETLSWALNEDLTSKNGTLAYFWVSDSNYLNNQPVYANKIFATEIISVSLRKPAIHVANHHYLYICVYKTELSEVSATAFKAYLKNNGIKLWVSSEVGTPHTWAAVDGDTYAAVGLELNSQLFDGDKVDTRPVKSRCDAKIVFDGSADETWSTAATSGNVGNRFIINVPEAPLTPADAVPKIVSSKYTALTPNQVSNGNTGITLGTSSALVSIFDKDLAHASLEEWKASLKKSPLTVWLKSATYDPENDIKLAFETHEYILYTLTGEETYAQQDSWNPGSVTISTFLTGAVSVDGYTSKANITCSHLVTETPANISDLGKQGCGQGGGTSLYLNFGNTYNTKELAVQYIKDQYAAGTPVQIKAKRSTPAIYAHEPADMSVFKDIEGNMTISAEGPVTVAFKSVSDASTLQGNDVWDIVEEAQPNFKTSSQLMPYSWINGEDVVRQVIELGPDDFMATSTTAWYPSAEGSSEQLVTTAESKKEVLHTSVEILPMTCAMTVSKDGNNYRPLSCARPSSMPYTMGVRYDKGTTGYKIALDIGAFHLDGFSKFVFVFYYAIH